MSIPVLHGTDMAGLDDAKPANADPGKTFYAMDTQTLYVYDPVDGWKTAARAMTAASALPANLTALTHAAPDADDFAVQALTEGGFGFVNANEGHTVLKVLKHVQEQVVSIRAALEDNGIITPAT